MAQPERAPAEPAHARAETRDPAGFWYAIHRVWAVGCLASLTLLIGVRWLRYTTWSNAPGLDHLVGEVMVGEQQVFLWPWAYSILKFRSVGLVAVVLVVTLHRRLLHRLVRRSDGLWRLTPLAVSLLLGVAVWVHYLFDLNPMVGLMCVTSLVLAGVTRSSRMDGLPRGAVLAVWVGFGVYWLVIAGDSTQRIAVVVWGLVLLATHRWVGSRTGPSELALLRAMAIIPMNLLPAVLPLYLPLHGGTLLGEGLAYSFCESPDGRTLYATIPVCDTPRTGYDDCRDGRIVEYDLRTMKEVATLRFFSPEFYGRLEQLVCLQDEVQVVVQAAVYQDRTLMQAVLSFPVVSPDKFTLLTADGGLGMTIAYDKQHDAFFYSGEFNNPLVRYDRRTKEFDHTPGREFSRSWIEPVALRPNDGSVILQTDSIHPGRNRLYLAEWMQGRYAYALDLTTLRVAARYDVGAGGSPGLTVDPERDRLFVSSLWGLEIFDLKTDKLIARKRTGLTDRPVVVDAARNRLYVSSTVEGKIRILDRDTLDVIGQIPVGMGVRYLQLSLDGRYLFATSAAAHYYWDADTLVRAAVPRPE